MCFAARPWGVTRTENRGIGVVSYSETPELEFGGPNDNRKLISISAMPQYINRSHEELRSKDYELLKVKGKMFFLYILICSMNYNFFFFGTYLMSFNFPLQRLVFLARTKGMHFNNLALLLVFILCRCHPFDASVDVAY